MRCDDHDDLMLMMIKDASQTVRQCVHEEFKLQLLLLLRLL
jgi:hypothetical protein